MEIQGGEKSRHPLTLGGRAVLTPRQRNEGQGGEEEGRRLYKDTRLDHQSQCFLAVESGARIGVYTMRC